MLWRSSSIHLLCSALLCSAVCPCSCLRARSCSSADGSGQSTTSGIKHRGRDYFKCQHNVMSCVRRSNVQTVLSGEQLIDQLRFVLLWPLRRADASASWRWRRSLCKNLACQRLVFDFCARMSTTTDRSEIVMWNEISGMLCHLAVNFADWFYQPHIWSALNDRWKQPLLAARWGQCWWETAAAVNTNPPSN